MYNTVVLDKPLMYYMYYITADATLVSGADLGIYLAVHASRNPDKFPWMFCVHGVHEMRF